MERGNGYTRRSALQAQLRPFSANEEHLDFKVFPFSVWRFDSGEKFLRLLSPWGFQAAEVLKEVDEEDYTVLDDDGYTCFAVTTGASNRTITLPTLADNQGRRITVVKADGGAGDVVVDGEGAETVSGAANETLGSQYDAVTVVAASAEWLEV